MVGVQSVLEGIVQTFGPFLIPVTVFAIGVVGYTVLFLVSRQFRPDEEEGVVNLSAGTPDRSATDNDHGASARGVLPNDREDDPDRDGAGGEESQRSEADPGTGGADGRTEDPLRRND